MTNLLSEVKQRRKALRLTQREFCIQSGVSKKTLSLIESRGYISTNKRTDAKIFATLAKLEAMGVGKAQ